MKTWHFLMMYWYRYLFAKYSEVSRTQGICAINSFAEDMRGKIKYHHDKWERLYNTSGVRKTTKK